MTNIKDHKISDQHVRGFYRTSKAWYATEKDKREPEVMFGMYSLLGGTSGEMAMRWKEIDGRMVPQLMAYDDSWKILSSFSDLIKELAKWDNKNITEEDFSIILSKSGFQDLTSYSRKLEQDKVRVVRSFPNNKMKR